MKDPVKFACRELPPLGAVLLSHHHGKAVFRMPHGGRDFRVEPGTSITHVRSVVANLRAYAYGLKGFTAVKLSRPVEPDVLVSSPHFRDRYTLMRDQTVTAGDVPVSREEVTAVIARPDWVMGGPGARLAFCGERLIVIAMHTQEQTALLSLLWSTDELWEKYPRPEGMER